MKLSCLSNYFFLYKTYKGLSYIIILLIKSDKYFHCNFTGLRSGKERVWVFWGGVKVFCLFVLLCYFSGKVVLHVNADIYQ